MNVESMAVDRHGFGRAKINGVDVAIQPLYQVPAEQYDRLDRGVEDAKRGA